jgi:ribosomal-protein-alanine N-acetyltransferase
MVAVAPLTTARLELRALRPADAADILTFRGDPEVQRFDEPVLRDENEALAFITEMQRDSVKHKRAMWALLRKDSRQVIGICGLLRWSEWHRRAELGFTLHRSCWGQGLMREAADRIVDYGFVEMGLHRVAAFTAVENARAIKLLEHLGFQREGTLRECEMGRDGRFHDWVQFGYLRRESTDWVPT